MGMRSCAYYDAFERPKIVYQEIQYHSNFAIDRAGRLGNNKTFLLTTNGPEILVALNSPIMLWHNWRYLPHMKDGALTPVAFKMEALPLPQFDDAARASAADLSNQASAAQRLVREAERAMLDWLRQGRGIKRPVGALASASGLDLDGFVTAVRSSLPKKTKVTAADIAELRREHAATIEPARRARGEIFALERQLSELVNEVHGLTPDEVDLMWRTAPPTNAVHAGWASGGQGRAQCG
ncbi:MAG: hypothetical protein JNJ73_11010 [Hyphomonadaceae bacterium]|nr:hypothetical protein [Hyphomonadaceae bacterium]